MRAEHAADLIKDKGMLLAAGVEVYLDPEYQHCQRVSRSVFSWY